MQSNDGPPAPYQNDGGAWIVSRYSDVVALLVRGDCVVAPRHSDDGAATVGWLRAKVARFSNGRDHARRRALVESDLHPMGTEALRRYAYNRTSAFCGQRVGASFDVVSTVARSVPASGLARSLGIDSDAIEEAVAAVRAIAEVYLSQTTTPQADAAVQKLVALLAPESPEVLANRIGILVQGCEAMAGLIGSALGAMLGRDGSSVWPVDGVLREILRHDPPVRIMGRRTEAEVQIGGVAIPKGATVILDLVAANHDPSEFPSPARFDPYRNNRGHLTFGAGLRPCPGGAQAIALCAGVVTAVVERCRLDGEAITYVGAPALHIPARLQVIVERGN